MATYFVLSPEYRSSLANKILFFNSIFTFGTTEKDQKVNDSVHFLLKVMKMKMWIVNIKCLKNNVCKYLYIHICQDINI